MPINDLQQFITLLDSQGELAGISIPTDPVLEIAAITDRVCKSADGGKGLLFETPSGSVFRVATNLFGSRRRVCLALEIERLERLTERMLELLNLIPYPDMARLDSQIATLPAFSRFSPQASSNHDPRLDAMEPPDLRLFPFLQSWPGDGSADGHPRYITLGQVFTRHPDSGEQNCGMYGAQLRGATELAMRWKAGSGAARHLESFRRRGQPMPVAIALGGAPPATFSAMFPLPGNLDEITFAGFLGSAPLETVPCRTVPLQVPAGCEVIIEGYVHPDETVREGPFGNHTGCYSPATVASLMRVTAISHRRNAIIPATVVGPPPMEDCWMAQAWERVLLALLKRLIPGVHELCFPLEWVFHQSAIISLENPNPAMVRETAARLWDTPWFSGSRLLIFVDAEVDISDMRGIAWRAINDCEFIHDCFSDSTGNRLALDATGRRLPRQRIERNDDIYRKIAKRWKEYGLT
jgi:4-hydroxy-3-polyprenylbenzoate decarboxylase